MFVGISHSGPTMSVAMLHSKVRYIHGNICSWKSMFLYSSCSAAHYVSDPVYWSARNVLGFFLIRGLLHFRVPCIWRTVVQVSLTLASCRCSRVSASRSRCPFLCSASRALSSSRTRASRLSCTNRQELNWRIEFNWIEWTTVHGEMGGKHGTRRSCANPK
jgi:hypothetical protein